jgi:hypothetical protein
MASAKVIKYDEYINPYVHPDKHKGASTSGHQWTIEVDGGIRHEWQDVLLRTSDKAYNHVDWNGHEPKKDPAP